MCDPLTNQIIDLSLMAKKLADPIDILKDNQADSFSNSGKRKLVNASSKIKRASVVLVEASFTMKRDPKKEIGGNEKWLTSSEEEEAEIKNCQLRILNSEN